MAEGKGKKKGGKLPIILVAVLVVAGGGFFAMSKGKGGEEEVKEPKLELGAVESLGDEFLVNLGDGRTFLSCKVSVQLRKPDPDVPDDHPHVADPAAGGDGHGGGGDPTYSIARDAVIKVLSGKSMDDVMKPDALKYLKREIAYAINHAVHHEEEADPKRKPKEDDHGDDHHEIDHEWLDELGWDHEEGPVLKVLFTDFAFQTY